MTLQNSTGLEESGYRPLTLKKKRAPYAEKRRTLQWDRSEIGQKAKMLAHIYAERIVGVVTMETERKFGASCKYAIEAAVEEIPGFIEWYQAGTVGEHPLDLDPKHLSFKYRGAYRFYQRVYNAYLNPQGTKEEGTRASRSTEHYMHPSKPHLRQWKTWALQIYQKRLGIKVRSVTPSRNETHAAPRR